MSTSILSTLPNAGSQDQRQLPLIVAEKWGFPLAFVETEDGVFYAIQDWIKGLTSAENIRRIWSDIQRSGNFTELSDSIVQLPYTASNDKTSGLSLTSPPGPLSNTWRGGEKRILKSPLHAMGRGFRGGVNA